MPDFSSPAKLASPESRVSSRWAALGFTLADYNRLLAAQDGHCAVCSSTPKKRRLHVDHLHGTKIVRGLLCMRHNRFTAIVGVTPVELRAMADYLERSL